MNRVEWQMQWWQGGARYRKYTWGISWSDLSAVSGAQWAPAPVVHHISRPFPSLGRLHGGCVLQSTGQQECSACRPSLSSLSYRLWYLQVGCALSVASNSWKHPQVFFFLHLGCELNLIPCAVTVTCQVYVLHTFQGQICTHNTGSNLQRWKREKVRSFFSTETPICNIYVCICFGWSESGYLTYLMKN